MTRYLTYAVWSIRLWLVDYADRCRDREIRLFSRLGDPESWFDRFVDRVSPLDSYRGYRRLGLRRALYMVRYPGYYLRRRSLRMVQAIARRLVDSYPMLGRYESYPPSLGLKAAWLDDHFEWHAATTGDSDWGLHAALFDLDVPWSLTHEAWTLTTDTRGFVTASPGTDEFERVDREYVSDSSNVDEFGGPDDSGWPNAEGDPTVNGAFGGTQVAQ